MVAAFKFRWQHSGHPGDLTATTDASGKTTTFTYDSYGDQTSVTDPTGRKTSFVYNTMGWRTSSVAPEGNKTGGTPSAHTTTWSNFTTAGQPQAVTDALGYSTIYAYDANGNTTVFNNEDQPTQVSLNGPTVSVTAYDDNGNVTSQADGLTHATTYTFDTLDRVTAVTDALGHATTYGYNTAGDQATITDPLGHVTTSVYDAGHQVTGTTDAENCTATYGYDPLGRLAMTTDAQNRVTRTSYDSLGRRTSTGQGTTAQLTAGTLPVTGSWTYDATGNVLTATDGATGTTTYTRDDAGRTLTVKDPLNRTTNLAYDADGNPITLTRPGAGTSTIVTSRAYDAAGQLTGIDYPAGTPDVSYSYDKTGARSSMTDGSGTTTYTYNSRVQLTGATRGTTAVGYGYDAAGRQTSIAYPGTSHTVTRGYDDADRLTSVTDWSAKTASYTWNDDDTLQKASLPSGVDTTYTYDNTALPTKILAVKGTTTISDLRYTYDNTSLLTAVSDMTTPTTPINHGYSWDSRTRLDAATGASNAGDYDYDGADRLTKAIGTTFTVDAAGQLTTSSTAAAGTNPAKTAAYSYNSLGNRTQTITTPSGGTATTKAYGYNAGDQLTSYSDSAVTGTSLAYTYDGDGLRASKARTVTGSGTTTMSWVWDTSGDLPDLLADGENYYFYGPDHHPFAQKNIATGTTTYLHADNNGSTIAASSPTGTRSGTWEYDAYGNTTAHTGTATTPYLYAGEYRDSDTGLTYLRARDYDPATGSFLTRDPLEDITAAPYTYTGGNPLQYADPTGLFWGGIGNFVKNNWRSVAKVAVIAAAGIAAGACVAATAGLCAGFSPLLTTAAVAGIGAIGGVADYALTDTCHSLAGFAVNAGIGAVSGLAGEGIGYSASKAFSGFSTQGFGTGNRLFQRLRSMDYRSDRGAVGFGDTADEIPVTRIYEHNPKHGSVTRTTGGRQVSRSPRGDCQAILDCSISKGADSPHRVGIEPESGLQVELRRHLVQDLGDKIIEKYHGYVPGG